MKKKTQKELFIEIMTAYDLSEEHKAFCQERINALEKKSENRAKTDTQKENDVLKENILEFLADNPNSSVATIRSQLGLSSPQKASALIKILTTEGKVVKKEEKKITKEDKLKNEIEKKITWFFIHDRVYYQDNDVGDAISNYLKVCRRG